MLWQYQHVTQYCRYYWLVVLGQHVTLEGLYEGEGLGVAYAYSISAADTRLACTAHTSHRTSTYLLGRHVTLEGLYEGEGLGVDCRVGPRFDAQLSYRPCYQLTPAQLQRTRVSVAPYPSFSSSLPTLSSSLPEFSVLGLA
eukprot:3388418-Rhodomonas_salina.6